MQDKDLHFCFGGVAEFGGIGGGNLYRNGNVAGKLGRFRWERQNIGGLVLLAKAAVQCLQFPAGGDANVDLTAQSDRALSFGGKQAERPRAGPFGFVLQNDHFRFKYKWEGTFSPPISWCKNLLG